MFHLYQQVQRGYRPGRRKGVGMSANRLKDRLKQISNVVSELIPEVEAPGITNKKGMIRKTVHSYSKVFDGNFGQVRDTIILETSWLGSSPREKLLHLSMR